MNTNRHEWGRRRRHEFYELARKEKCLDAFAQVFIEPIEVLFDVVAKCVRFQLTKMTEFLSEENRVTLMIQTLVMIV